MPLEILPRFLFRAPLLPVKDASRPAREIFREPLPSLALALASPSLAAQTKPTAEAQRARGNFARRAAFRPTPHGLWAGVGVGTLATRTRLLTGEPRASLTVSYARLSSLARARLDDDAFRARARLRLTPSLFADGARLAWLAMGAGSEAVARAADRDELLDEVVARAQSWCPFEALAAIAGDELLLMLVDDGLLVSDLQPPLVGAPPLSYACDRDDELVPVAELLARAAETQDVAAVDEARARLAELPGGGDGDALHAVLVHDGDVTLSRAAVERAAALAPLLFRVQEALMPPAAERALPPNGPAIAAALDAITEIFGAGAFALPSLALGHFGTALDAAADAAPPAADARMVALFADAAVAAARTGSPEAALDVAALDALAPPLPTPPTFELMLMPAREPPRSPPGTGWLVGLHAPAGATWGRFVHAVGAPLAEAFAMLTAGEPDGACEVAYCPSPALGDLCAHPPLRDAIVPLTSWPADPNVGADGADPVRDEGGA